MLSKRASSITPSMTLGISNKVKILKKQNISVLNLSIGEPDFFTPEKVKNAGIDAIKNNITKYDAASGNLQLRQAICDKFLKDANAKYDADDIVVSSGAKYSITNTILTIADEGDNVIVPAPYWVSYPETLKLCGVTPKIVNTNFESGFKLNREKLLQNIDEKTKAVIITNPSNPTGSVYTKEELLNIANVCLEKNIMIIADEIYEKIVYDKDFVSFASLGEEIKNISIIIGGMSKSVSMTGWRIGYTACRKDIAKAMGSIQSHLVSHPSTISQAASIEGILNCEPEIKEMVEIYKIRRNKACKLLDNINGISYVKPDGAFYIFINISEFKKYINEDSISMYIANKLLDDKKVAVVPGIAFGNDDFIRISYATDIETLEKGIEKIAEITKEIIK